ncbi:MAG: DUF2341 domain-containing protein [Chitinispirillaceae bacterium]|nr:DUF2341 domain-containing protein [Chitinispirillaceae bacterium]
MMPHRPMITLVAVPGVVMMLMLGCSRNHDLAGATTETTNGVVGSIRNGDDTPAQNTVVRLLPDGYDPVSDGALDRGFIDTTDAEGAFSFRRIAPGRYAVLARKREAALSSMIRDVTVTDDSVTAVPPANLDKSGSIATDFSSSGSTLAGGYVYIPGTDIFSTVENDGSAFLGDVPPGTVSAVILASGNNGKRNVLRNEITVTAGDTVTIEQPLWKYSRRLGLNTTPDGAGVAADVCNFPVLIRLNSGNFDFTQARTDGGDFMFVGSDKVALPYEIERLDASGGRAEIWVKVDTIFGNDSGQSITMYWGNPDAADSSRSNAVFDTAAGFQGVWHMGDAADGTFRDATINRYEGVTSDTARPQVAEGAIGNCSMFDGAADYITMPNTADGRLNFKEKDYYTVCAWVFIDTFDRASHCIVSKGYQQYYLRSTYISADLSFTTPVWEFVEFSETDNWQPSTSPAASGQWALLVGVRQGTRQFLFCNGVLVDSTVDVWQNAVSRNTANDLYIGRFKDSVTVPPVQTGVGYNYFKGSIDEVRIISAAQSPDWVRLCYMNQRPDDRLVVFR